MEERVLRLVAAIMMAAAIGSCALLPCLPQLYAWEKEAREKRIAEEEYADVRQEQREREQMIDIDIQEDPAGEPPGEELPGDLRIRLPEGADPSKVDVQSDCLTRAVRVELPGAGRAYFDSDPISGSSSYLDTLTYAEHEDHGVVEFVTDRVYELEIGYDDEYFYFSFLQPHEKYDKVVVVDAGHGGRAPGATKQGINEKDIDLAIVQKIREAFESGGGGIGVYFTRLDDSNPTFDQRVQLANLSGADLFVSIHNNATASGIMSSTSGTQVMYDEESEESRRFAQICLEEVTAATGSRDRGLVKGDRIYIIRNSEPPVALIEVGFMTNQEELGLLSTEEYQKKAAEGVYKAVLRAFEEGF